MRIGLLLPLNISFAPYLKIYTKILDKIEGIEYDVIYCDKKGLKETAKYRFDLQTKDNVSKLKKLIYYYRYSRFIIKVLKKEKYDKLIVFGPQIAVFIHRYLCKYYQGKFVMDYRDLSIDLRFKKIYRKILNASAVNPISSPGFKEYLPERDDYIISHNFDIDILRNAIKDIKTDPYCLYKPDGKYHIMTIGGIRHFEQNRDVIKALSNNNQFQLTFAGRGFGVPLLQEYVKQHNVNNVAFTGFYEKKDEPGIISQATFINIYYSLEPNPRTAISNRFYNSIIYRKPMITTIGTTQGEYAKKYGIGIATENIEALASEIIKYEQEFDSVKYEEKRQFLLNKFLEDYQVFERAIINFVTGN